MALNPVSSVFAADEAPAEEKKGLTARQAMDEQAKNPWPYSMQPVDLQPVLDAAGRSAEEVPSVFLTPQQRREAVETFIRLTRINSQCTEEAAIREELRQRMIRLGAREIANSLQDTNAPKNLVMELPATQGFQDQPPLLLNAHMDSIPHLPKYDIFYTPEEMDFNPVQREFFHVQNHCFGADDKSGLSVLLGALAAAKTQYWDKGVGHRRIVVIFTAQEENGGHGARYLAEKRPEVFAQAAITITSDGPLDYHGKDYPENSFVVVVEPDKARIPPFSRIVDFVREMSAFKRVSFAMTTEGLGTGDFSLFPAEAKADLHIRSPHQGQHDGEKLKIDDLLNHVDLFTYIVLRLDGASFEMDMKDGRLRLAERKGERPSFEEVGRITDRSGEHEPAD